MQVTVDIETMDTRASAIVLSMGYSFFDPMKNEPFMDIVNRGEEVFFEVGEQTAKGRTHSQSTLEWWMSQSDAAQRCLAPDSMLNVRDFYTVFEASCEKNGLNVNWVKKHAKWVCRGPHFDIAILESLFDDFNMATPWKYYNVRDIRTWLECNNLPDNLKLVKPEDMIAHNALHDAAFDAWMIQQINTQPFEALHVDTR